MTIESHITKAQKDMVYYHREGCRGKTRQGCNCGLDKHIVQQLTALAESFVEEVMVDERKVDKNNPGPSHGWNYCRDAINASIAKFLGR